jgi:hypothetical protein
LINADCGGSNGARLRLWKCELQVLADELGIEITVCHVPPGTSKWNKIEHRLFSFITQNRRGKPLISYLVWRGGSPGAGCALTTASNAVRTVLRCHMNIDILPRRKTLAAPDPAIWAEAI